MAVNQVQEWEIVITIEDGQAKAISEWEGMEDCTTMSGYDIYGDKLIISGFECESVANQCNDKIKEFLNSL